MEGKVSYEEFREDILKEVSREMGRQGSYECRLVEMPKNNALLHGISIRSADTAAAPVFYLEDPYRQYLEGKTLQQIGREMAGCYKGTDLPVFSEEDISDYGKVKDQLRLRLVNKEKNDRYYKKGPYRQKMIGVEVLYVELERSRDGSRLVQVTNAMADRWGIPPQELFRTALENSQNHDRSVFFSMAELINGILPEMESKEDSLPPMYVLTNERKEYGATVASYPNVLKQVREQLGGDYYILPSSLHELIILPKTCGMDAKELRSMVREINQSQVVPEEVLGNEAYEFCGTTGRVHKCVKEERER